MGRFAWEQIPIPQPDALHLAMGALWRLVASGPLEADILSDADTDIENEPDIVREADVCETNIPTLREVDYTVC